MVSRLTQVASKTLKKDQGETATCYKDHFRNVHGHHFGIFGMNLGNTFYLSDSGIHFGILFGTYSHDGSTRFLYHIIYTAGNRMNIDLSVKWGAVLIFGLAAVGRSGTLVWRAAKGRLCWIVLTFWRRACLWRAAFEITQALGARPKVSLLILAIYMQRAAEGIDHSALLWAAEGVPCLQFADPCACA